MTDPTEMAKFAAALDGQYALEREIGRGGMGVVYVARDLKLDRRVAIKTLPPHLAGDTRVRQRFLREARTAAALSHPNIVPIHRADELGGHVFFVMGYVDGASLAQRVIEHGALGTRDALIVVRDVALALGYAHAHRIVHRDVKAENILLESRDRGSHALVTDFGIARTAEAAPITATGHVLGSVHYMSPEQIAGEEVDGRSDLYSLGVVGYYALAGRFPFESETASAILIAHVTKPTPRLRDVAPAIPAEITAAIDRCLKKAPADRFQSADDLVAVVDALIARLPADAPATATSTPAIPSIISETEAKEIWRRAAELQDDPSARAALRDAPPTRDDEMPRKPATLTTGYRLEQIRAAAEEAGIDAEALSLALEEHGLVPSSRLPVLKPRTPPATTSTDLPPAAPGSARSDFIREDLPDDINPFIGTARRIGFSASLDGEVAEDELFPLVDVIRRSVDEVGHTAMLGRSLTWNVSNRNRKIEISVVPRGGRTTIRVHEVLTPLSGRLFGGVIGASVWMGMVTFSIIAGRAHNPLGGLAAAAALVGTGFLTARGIFGYLADRRRGRLRTLVERLATHLTETSPPSAPALRSGEPPVPTTTG